MHLCFENPKLVESILSHLGAFDRDDKASLAVLARTARLFHEPALAILWWSQNSLVNLLRVMPYDLFREEVIGGKCVFDGKRTFRLLRPIVAADWERVRLYASRVREFHSFHEQDHLCYSTICPILSLTGPDDCLFPNLLYLRWDQSDDNFPHIRLLMGPEITRVHISCTTPSQLSLLSVLPRKCPSLKDATIDLPDPAKATAATRNSVSAFIRELNSIEHLNIHILDVAALQHAAELPSLQSLQLSSLPAELSTLTLAEEPLFVPLRHLRLANPNIPLTARFLEMCASAALETFGVEYGSYASPGDIERLLTALAVYHRSSITVLDIDTSTSVGETDGSGADSGVFTFHCLRPALGFRKLTHLYIWSKYAFDFDDVVISQMAQAWPQLESLDISEENPLPTIRTTLVSLQLLARHCPHLANLRMSFTTSDIPSFTEPIFANQNLRSVDVKDSPILASQTLAVACFISAIFPNLRSVDADKTVGRAEQEENACYGRWKEIEELLRVRAFVEVCQKNHGAGRK